MSRTRWFSPRLPQRSHTGQGQGRILEEQRSETGSSATCSWHTAKLVETPCNHVHRLPSSAWDDKTKPSILVGSREKADSLFHALSTQYISTPPCLLPVFHSPLSDWLTMLFVLSHPLVLYHLCKWRTHLTSSNPSAVPGPCCSV